MIQMQALYKSDIFAESPDIMKLNVLLNSKKSLGCFKKWNCFTQE